MQNMQKYNNIIFHCSESNASLVSLAAGSLLKSILDTDTADDACSLPSLRILEDPSLRKIREMLRVAQEQTKGYSIARKRVPRPIIN